MPSHVKKYELAEPLALIDQLIKKGQILESRKAIEELAKKKIPREKLCEFSHLARRVNLNSLALKLLNPLVRPGSKKLFHPTDEEKVEYCNALIWLGAISEAKWLLREVDSNTTPSAHLACAYANIFEWNYEAAIVPLKKYVSSVDSYSRIVGQLNLVAALIAVRHIEEATPLLNELKASTRTQYPRIYANLLELSTQASIYDKDFAKASKYIQEARSFLRESPILDSLYIEKWQLVCEVLSATPKKTTASQLLELKQKAIQSNHWETARECDKYLAILTKDKSLLFKVYYGTPFPEYRKLVLKDFPENVAVPRTYLWSESTDTSKSKHVLSLFDGTFNGESTGLKLGHAMHRLLLLLSSDFYKPFQTASLFNGIFPGEYFHPQTGPARVYQTLKYVRAWLVENKIPLKISAEDGYFRLIHEDDLKISLTASESRRHPQLRVLFSQFNDEPFSAKQASTTLKLPLRSVQRFLSSMVSENLLASHGTKNSLKYSIVRKSS